MFTLVSFLMTKGTGEFKRSDSFMHCVVYGIARVSHLQETEQDFVKSFLAKLSILCDNEGINSQRRLFSIKQSTFCDREGYIFKHMQFEVHLNDNNRKTATSSARLTSASICI